MLAALALALAASLPLAAGALRRPGRAPSWPLLASAPALYAAAALAGFALRRREVTTALFPRVNDERGFMTLAALAVHGLGVALPLAGLAAALWCARSGARGRARALGAWALASLALASWALVAEPATLVERRYALRSPRAPAGGLTLLHVSDLQTDGPCRRERLAVEAASRELPDFVLFTGDLTNGLGPRDDPEARARAANAFLRGLRARHAVLAVYGDWDAWGADWPRWERRMLAGTSARFLYNEAASFELPGGRVVIYGSGGGGPAPVTVVPDLAGERGYRVVMAHHPDPLAEGLRAGGADLALAGHTHGGQVVLPFVGAPVTHNAHGFVGGRYDVRGVPVIVSRGIGMRGGPAPRVRFRCPPEVGWIRVTN